MALEIRLVNLPKASISNRNIESLAQLWGPKQVLKVNVYGASLSDAWATLNGK